MLGGGLLTWTEPTFRNWTPILPCNSLDALPTKPDHSDSETVESRTAAIVNVRFRGLRSNSEPVESVIPQAAANNDRKRIKYFIGSPLLKTAQSPNTA